MPMYFDTNTDRLRITGSGSLWTPSNLSGLVEWWDAQYGVAVNTTVTSWTGRVGTVASQATVANQPAYSATARNNKPGVSITAASQFLGFSPGTVFPYAAANHTIFAAIYETGSSANGAALSWGGSSTGTLRGLGDKSNNATAFYYNEDHVTAISCLNTDRFLFSTITGGTASSITVDGGTANTTTLATALNTPASSSGYIGKGPSVYYGYIQQLGVINRVVTLAEQQKLEGWESWWDGKAGSNLPSGHPYKSRAPLTSD